MMLSKDESSGQKALFFVLFFLARKENCSYHRPTRVHLSLRSACLCSANSRLKVTDASRSVKAEPSEKVCETAEAPTSYKSAIWRHFGFLVARNEKRDKVTDRKQYVTLPDWN